MPQAGHGVEVCHQCSLQCLSLNSRQISSFFETR